MPENAQKLTKRVIDLTVPGERRFEIWDVELKGFGLRVEPSGVKSFILRYRPGGRRSAKRFVNLGRYGAVTPDEARRQAREHLGAVARGIDPAQERARKRAAATIGEAAQRFIDEHVVPKRKPSTIVCFGVQLWLFRTFGADTLAGGFEDRDPPMIGVMRRGERAVGGGRSRRGRTWSA